ncbi:MAG: MarR family transcriptional regulator [Deltaproteobacteria bacterium]|nr:MAG: MarR family transcriptional regulator [Desulfobulbaceae bacterium]TDB30955.1 MAG: MarR family transcriptional regulator [Deltaproteobacteria bacterium]
MKFTYNHNHSLGYLSGLTNRLLGNLLAKRFQEAGIDMTSEQWGAIIVLLNGGAMTQMHLGEQLCLEKSSVSRLVNGLEKRGWVERAKNLKDNRQNIVTPTQKVLETAEHCAVIARRILEEAQRGMTEDEMLVFRSLLSKTIKNLKKLQK